jgi:hypothetical protein
MAVPASRGGRRELYWIIDDDTAIADAMRSHAALAWSHDVLAFGSFIAFAAVIAVALPVLLGLVHAGTALLLRERQELAGQLPPSPSLDALFKMRDVSFQRLPSFFFIPARRCASTSRRRSTAFCSPRRASVQGNHRVTIRRRSRPITAGYSRP